MRPDFYGDVAYVIQYRRDPKYKFVDWGLSTHDRVQALGDLRRLRTVETRGREFRLICRTTSITEIEVPEASEMQYAVERRAAGE